MHKLCSTGAEWSYELLGGCRLSCTVAKLDSIHSGYIDPDKSAP